MKKPTVTFVTYVLFPTKISDDTEINIEHDGGAQIWFNIEQGDKKVSLNYDECKKIAEYINGMELKEKK